MKSFWRIVIFVLVLIAAGCKSTPTKDSITQLPEPPQCKPIAKVEPPAPVCPACAKCECPKVVQPVCPQVICPAPPKPECPAVVATAPKPRRISSAAPFANYYEQKIVFDRLEEEYQRYGKPINLKHAKKKKFRGSLIEQRSGRKRLFDHNLFLRKLFSGKLVFREFGRLGDEFEGAVFFDIGSAILSDEGAVTVRDLFEDKQVAPHLKIVASDINDKGSPKTRYIEIYRKKKEQLPFDVVEISPSLTEAARFLEPISVYLKGDETAVMLRAVNAGPDLYYEPLKVRKHLLAAISAFEQRSVLYFYNKFILYKPKGGNYFMLLGEIDASIGTNHKETTWEDVDWSKRRFEDAIFLNRAYW